MSQGPQLEVFKDIWMKHQLLSQPFKPQDAKSEPTQIRKLDFHVHIWCRGRGSWGKAESHLAQKAFLIYKFFEVGELLETGSQVPIGSQLERPGPVLESFWVSDAHKSFIHSVVCLSLASARLCAKGQGG